MYDEEFAPRLITLRTQKNVSAREMSLAIGQSPSYITSIESRKALPSMSVFFAICDYLDISPSEFFNTQNSQPDRMRDIIKNLQKLDNELLNNIAVVINNLAK